MTCVDTRTWQDYLQGHVPQFPQLTSHQRDRLRALSQLHPERRGEFLKPTDEDFPVLSSYLRINPERLRQVLQDSA